MGSQSRGGGAPGNDSFVEQLGDRLSADGGRKVLPLRRPDAAKPRSPSGEQAQVPPSDAFPPPPAAPPMSASETAFDGDEPTYTEDHRSDVHELPPASSGDDLLDGAVPYVEHPEGAQDPFAQFEDELEGESTRIDTQHLIAEQTTNILEESPDPPFLEVESGKDQGKQFILNPGETSIGRSIDNDVILTDIAVSRRHLSVTLNDDGSLRLHDLGSGNGTQLNGRRVYDNPLTDGDRIELGETVLIVRIPSDLAVLEEWPDHGERSTTDEEAVPSLPPPATMGMPNQPGARSEPTGFVPEGGARNISTDYITSPPAYGSGPGVIVPRGWLLAGVIVGGLLVALLGASMTALLLRSDSTAPAGTPPVAGDPEEVFSVGVEAYESGRWDEAQQAFEQVLAAEPDHEEAQQRLQRVAEAREHSQALASARAALEGGDAEAALSRIASIPDSSPVSSRAEALRREAQSSRVDELVRQGMAAVAEEDLETAARRLADATTISADADGVRELGAAIEDARGSAGRAEGTDRREERAERTRPVQRRATRRESRPARREQRSAQGQGEARALTAYRQGNFSGAAQAARTAADSASDADRRELLGLARRIEQFASAYQRAESAGFGASAVRQMQSAVTLDERISGGHYARRIRPRLVEAYLAQGRSALGRGDASSGCQSVRQALAIDSGSSAARSMARSCDERAAQMFRRAQGLERQNRNEAIQLYRQVLTMVPRGSPHYTQAYQRLNNLARRSGVDEDE